VYNLCNEKALLLPSLVRNVQFTRDNQSIDRSILASCACALVTVSHDWSFVACMLSYVCQAFKAYFVILTDGNRLVFAYVE
jgi:hypothetical protein